MYRRSISRILVNSGFESKVSAFKPMLTKKHKNERFEMMKKWSMWSASKFQRIIFSNKCRFEVDGNDGTQRIRRLSSHVMNQAILLESINMEKVE